MKRKWIFLTIFGGIVLLIVAGWSWQQIIRPRSTIIKSTPTIFLHGWGSSVNAEHQMTSAMKKSGITNSVTQAIVSPEGKVKLIGSIPKHAKNPVVEVGFKNNKNTDYHEDGQWLKNVITELQNTYQIKNVNLVGHSMGNMAIAYYILDHSNNSSLPKLRKQVDMAGHFDGIIGMNDKPNLTKLDDSGKPDRMDDNYRTLLGLRKKYPNKQVHVLNIFGDKNDGSHSDGSVTNASSQSLRYLIGERAKTYQEKKIIGADGQHSRLHENKEVDQILIKFLWP
ncbi:alpha/beta hydrolase [Xylocopilactobacillus apicola]|uniref:Alpha/beta hydrolase n=1 Tax=Xylocopilactobacillus apicola TaxID=2932184 RepID=A0AAU9DT27_9LACO|nr:alpha/beta hydrolase [Xylocopilactobacillus apicola]BDR58493.1 alpha/beta hydrolase [Xylocopilactobacillus apicola]